MKPFAEDPSRGSVLLSRAGVWNVPGGPPVR